MATYKTGCGRFELYTTEPLTKEEEEVFMEIMNKRPQTMMRLIKKLGFKTMKLEQKK